MTLINSNFYSAIALSLLIFMDLPQEEQMLSLAILKTGNITSLFLSNAPVTLNWVKVIKTDLKTQSSMENVIMKSLY